MARQIQQLHLMDTPAAASMLGLAARTLEKYRLTGAGPRFLKLGARVLYDPRDLDKWVAARRRTSTSDRGEGAAV